MFLSRKGFLLAAWEDMPWHPEGQMESSPPNPNSIAEVTFFITRIQHFSSVLKWDLTEVNSHNKLKYVISVFSCSCAMIYKVTSNTILLCFTGSASKHFWVLQTRMIHFPRTLQSTGRQMKQKLLRQVLSIMFLFSSLVYIGILAPCNFKSFMANGSRGLSNLSLRTELRKFSLFHPFVIYLQNTFVTCSNSFFSWIMQQRSGPVCMQVVNNDESLFLRISFFDCMLNIMYAFLVL